MFNEIKIGSKQYETEMNKLTDMFTKYGFTAKRVDNESIMIENESSVGAFTLRDDGYLAGGMLPVSQKSELLTEVEDRREVGMDIRMGWACYEMRESLGNHDLSFHEVEMLIR